ncbi:MAG: sigma factor-like helix-turn-helix DNA-binding protein, partial [Planctomycetota bacterium]
IGRTLELSRERVRQIEHEATARLHEQMQSQLDGTTEKRAAASREMRRKQTKNTPRPRRIAGAA